MEILVVTKEAEESQIVLKTATARMVSIPSPMEILVMSKTPEGFIFEPKTAKEIIVTVDI